MAGAGFKTFNTGDVLTASDVNTYLMQQTTMVFADASARSTALGANVAEGMISYLKDTNATEVYDGSSWVAISGDITGVTAGTGLTGGGTSGAVTLDFDVANYGGGQRAAGKNKIINGDFNIWQRGTSFTSVANGTYTSDRWVVEAGGGSGNVTQQSFTAGSELGNNQYFLRFTKSTTGDRGIAQRIEDVRTLAGQTITVSFWMKGSVSGSLDSVLIIQRFGSGGSSEVVTNALSSQAFTTSWVRYSATVTLPSISGKTIGAGNNLTIRIDPADAFTGDFDIWGVQVEAGSVSTPFQTATGNLASELAACQRYYLRINGDTAVRFGTGYNVSTTRGLHMISYPVEMRIRPTALEQSGTASDYAIQHGNFTNTNLSAVPTYVAGTRTTACIQSDVASGLTAGQGSLLYSNNANAYFAWSAEL